MLTKISNVPWMGQPWSWHALAL